MYQSGVMEESGDNDMLDDDGDEEDAPDGRRKILTYSIDYDRRADVIV